VDSISAVLTRWRNRSRSEAPASPEVLRERLAELSSANRRSRRPARERELLRVRHQLGLALLEDPAPWARFAAPGGAPLPPPPLPEFGPGDLTSETMRAAILRDGCAFVRGLIPRDRATALAEGIEAAFDARDRRGQGAETDAGFYEEFEPDARFGEVPGREWIQAGGGLLAADSPAVAFSMFEAYGQAGLASLVSGYLGEPAVISVHKTTLRRADPSVSGAWHQDGRFMGPVRSLNLWLALSRCGDEAPGLDIVPRRIDDYLATGTDDAPLGWTIADQQARGAAADIGVVRPVFEPGDAIFFDELFLHKTGSSPDMTRPRYAIENWFFAPGGFPPDYAPLAT
jgi:hypothetical protein